MKRSEESDTDDEYDDIARDRVTVEDRLLLFSDDDLDEVDLHESVYVNDTNRVCLLDMTISDNDDESPSPEHYDDADGEEDHGQHEDGPSPPRSVVLRGFTPDISAPVPDVSDGQEAGDEESDDACKTVI